MNLNKWIKEWYDLYEAELDEMMHDIWAHPETGLKNGYAAKRAAEFAKTHGFPDAMLMRAGQGIKPSDNPNTVFATYGEGKPVIAIVGELDALPDLCAFADRLEKATLDTIESGVMTRDLALMWDGEAQAVNSRQFLQAIAERMN